MELWNKSRKKGTSTLITCLEREYLSSTYTSVWHYVFIYLLLSFLLDKDYSLSRIIWSFTVLSSIGNSNWYVFAILVMYIIVYISFKYFKKNGITSCAIMSILYIILMKAFKGQDWWYNIILCFPAGMILSKYKDKVCSIIRKPIFFVCMFILALVLYIFHLHIFAYEVIAISLCFLIVDICAYKEIKNDLFQFLGQYVFEIYILQRVSMIIFKRYFHEWIYFLICIVVTFGLAYVFKKLETKIDMLI